MSDTTPPAANAAAPSAPKSRFGANEVIIGLLVVVILFLAWEWRAARLQRDQALQLAAEFQAQLTKQAPAIDATGKMIETGAKTTTRVFSLFDQLLDVVDPPKKTK